MKTFADATNYRIVAMDSGICGRFRSRTLKPSHMDTTFWDHNSKAMDHDFAKAYHPLVAALDVPGTRSLVRLSVGHAAQGCVNLFTGGVALALVAGLMACGHGNQAEGVGQAYMLQIAMFAGALGIAAGASLAAGLVCVVIYPAMQWASAPMFRALAQRA